MTNNYYEFISNPYEKESGNIECKDAVSYPNINDGEEVNLNPDFFYELEDGEFCHYHIGPWGVNLVDDILKDLITEYAEGQFIEFVPVPVKSKEYGDRQYYIVHFKKIYDVVDWENSDCNPPGNVIRMCVDYEKVKNLHAFNSGSYANGMFFPRNDIIVSTKIYKEIKKRKLNFGLSFGIIRCLNK